ncbi:MAG TPA: ATP-grasp domain-containing protein [Pirellulales bacterium]|nr:ATP-grasp domain-containing protein [Pirellulales bacterium]
MRESLLILGASVRAAAQSAARIGLRPFCGDLFCDADLPECAIGQVARSFPTDLLRIAEQAPAGLWMYTGGLENYPRVVARISRRHELLGTAPKNLRRVRDPFELHRVFGRAGLLVPECRESDERVPRDGGWLIKHRGSSAGLRVFLWQKDSPSARTRGWYFQRRIEGLSVGAVFVAAEGHATLLGICEQLLVSVDERPFQYGGSVGPLSLGPDQQAIVTDIGRVLAAEFELRGLFGVDLIVAADGVWTIEVNPRYTASVEVLERVFGFNAVSLQIAACREGQVPVVESPPAPSAGKSILYAERTCEITADKSAALEKLRGGQPWPIVGDVPRTGTRIERGQPALTLFADGPSAAAVRESLRSLSAEVRAELGL